MRSASKSRPKIAKRGEAEAALAMGWSGAIMRCNAMQEGSGRRLEEACVRAGVWASLIGSATGGQRKKQS